MALLDRARSLTTARPSDARLGRAAGSGLVAAALSWLIVLVLAALAWGMSPQGTTGFGEVIGVASAAWFLATGGSISVDGATVGVVPLGLWACAIWLTGRGWSRVRHTSERPLLTDARDFLLGYAAWGAFAGLLSLLAPARPTVAALVVVWSVPVVALIIDLARHPAELEVFPRVTDAWERVPTWARQAGRPARHALAALTGIAALVVALTVLVHWGTVREIAGALSAGTMGDVVLLAGQLAYLPTLGLWALSVVAGPGFQVAAGGTVTLSGSHPGLLPMIPVLGAVPGEASYPAVAWLAVLLPVAAGAVLGRATMSESGEFTRWRDTVSTIGLAAALAAGTIGALALLSSGPAGSGRLSWLGPHPVALAAYLWVELSAGGLLWWVVERFVTPRLQRGAPARRP